MGRASRCLILWALLGTVAPSSSAALKALDAGDPVPPVQLSDEAFARRPLAEQLGPKGALVVFWASWSPRSADLLRYLGELDRKYGAQGLRVIPVNVDHEGLTREQAGEVARLYQGWNLPWATRYDPALEAFASFGVITSPTSVYIGADSRIFGVYPGFPTEAREGLEELVQKGLGIWKAPVEPQRAGPVAYEPKNGAGRRLNMAKLLIARGQRLKAAEEAATAAEKDPEYALAYAAAGFLSENPEPWIAKLRTRAGGDAGFREALGALFAALGRREEALELLEPLAAGEEPRPRVFAALALLRFRAGDSAGARQLLERLEAWPLGGVALRVDAREFVDPGVPLEEQ